MDFDVLTFIGRFQPFHNGHKSVVDFALTKANKVALVIGSDQQPRTARNPFTTQERIDMISAVYPKEVEEGRIRFCPQVDHTYNIKRWIAGVEASTRAVAHTPFTPDPVKMGLIGHSKDASSFYLKSFPTYESIEAANYKGLNATDIRRGYFEATGGPDGNLPLPVVEFMLDFRKGEDFKNLKEEYDFLKDYKKQFIMPSGTEIEEWLWENETSLDQFNLAKKVVESFCPKYPPVFYTADAVVVQSGHILLVKRGAMPGKGLWALPGGFVNEYENSFDAALRELREETRLAVPEAVLRGSQRSWRLFEDPYRSQRGRTLTYAYYFDLRPSEELPKIKGADDAEKAQWIPLANLRREVMFEDHYDIIETLVGL